jgi:RHS repeat-associated protein
MTQRQAINPDDTDGVQRQGERTWYVYDTGGQRVRKVTELANGQVKDERLYLGGFELYRRSGANALVRETLHILDGKQRIAMVETRTLGTETGVPARLIRYQHGNQLGSAGLELDDHARVLSYEEYTPFGSSSYQAVQRQTQVPKRYRYTGKERDEESGLYYHGARYYAPWLGRWSAVDPAGFVDGLNLYAYARNNPLRYTDPDGRATKEQFAEQLTAAINQIASGNRTAKGKAGEIVLEELLQDAGHIIIKGPVNNPGAHKADVVSYDPESKQLLFFDNKVKGFSKNVSKAEAFVSMADEAETLQLKRDVIADARAKFRDIEHLIPEEHLDDIRAAFKKAVADPTNANFVISNASPGVVRNLVERVSQRLIDRGVRFVDASKGGKQLQTNINQMLGKNADETASALKSAGGAGQRLAKALPGIGLGVAGALAIPRVANAAAEDTAYEETMRSMGEEPKLKGLSVLRELAVISGEETGGELGGWGGAALGASVTWETGPGIAVGAIAGAVIFGFAGDTVGGDIAGYLFDKAANDLYQQRVVGGQ